MVTMGNEVVVWEGVLIDDVANREDDGESIDN